MSTDTDVLHVHCLYSWTDNAIFQLSRQSRSSSSFASKLELGLNCVGLLEVNGDWCGTMIMKDTWLARVGDIIEFAAISDARDFSMEELDRLSYCAPEDRQVSEWHLYWPSWQKAIPWRKGLSWQGYTEGFST